MFYIITSYEIDLTLLSLTFYIWGFWYFLFLSFPNLSISFILLMIYLTPYDLPDTFPLSDTF
jgi:hypothetical protein